MTLLAFLSMGITELMVIATVALLVFGGELPDVMRNVGRAYGRLRSSINEIASPVREEIRRVDRQIQQEARAARQATSLRELQSASNAEADGDKRAEADKPSRSGGGNDPITTPPAPEPTAHYPEDPARDADVHPLRGTPDPDDGDWDDEPPPV